MMMTTVPSYLTHCLVSGLLQELPRCTGFLVIIVETISSSPGNTTRLQHGCCEEGRLYSRLQQATAG